MAVVPHGPSCEKMGQDCRIGRIDGMSEWIALAYPVNPAEPAIRSKDV